MASTSDIEKENLETHVELCALRYEALEKRLSSIEGKVSTLSELVEQGQLSMTKVLIGTAGTVIAGVISTLVIILVKFPH